MSRALAACAALLLLACAPRARAAGAPADTTLDGYVRSMADSTDAWFGLSAEPADTSGIDSVRAVRLAHPLQVHVSNGRSLAFAPLASFSRVLGPAYGGDVALGLSREWGRVTASALWTGGADLWLGDGAYVKRWVTAADVEHDRVNARAGRSVASLDRDFSYPMLSAVAAFVWGSDRDHYLRRDGAQLEVAHHSPAWWAGAGARAERETPLATTASWYLTGHGHLAVFANDSATAGRVHELSAYAGVKLARFPLVVDAEFWRAGGGLGGDLDYVRRRVTAGAAFALGRHLVLAPQADWGRLTGTPVVQEAFSLGGTNLRTLDADRVRGTWRAAGHVDLILNDPLQRLIGERQPAMPIQLAAFAGAAAAWGVDPLTHAPVVSARDWPAREQWTCEAGVSLLYRPGIPQPEAYVRLDWAHPLGPSAGRSGFYVSYSRPLNFLRGR